MNKKIWLAIFFLIMIFSFFLFLVSVFVTKHRVDLAQTRGKELYQIYGQRQVGQTFVANKNNLEMIIVNLRNGRLRNQQPIYFYLQEANRPQNLRKLEINGFNIGDPSLVKFQFEPIPDSAGKTYYFYLESPDSNVNDAVEIVYNEQDIYSSGKMVLSEEEKKADLYFVVNYYPGNKQVLAKEMMTDWLVRLQGDGFFVFNYLTLLTLILILGLLI
ncbi:hypothetical protein A2Z41_02170 [Microgenomates group bacterium RBG_19FT_COMBO_39_10]|nr:MAG: hypothetical protein A2Z41_02170 [Microgenomates group bacterium RBG_19FT_COMBO_39_10]